MRRDPQMEEIIASVDLSDYPAEGAVLQPLDPLTEEMKRCFADWDTPLAPRGGFRLDSGIAVVSDADGKVLEFTGKRLERALVTRASFRDCRISAQIEPVDSDFSPHNDRNDCSEALVGLICRMETSRRYYLFGIEGKSRAVLYRRMDDEWFPLAEKPVELPDGYIDLEVLLDGDAIRCRSNILGVSFFCTDDRIKVGKMGVRSAGRARVRSLSVSQTKYQRSRDENRAKLAADEEERLGHDIPDPVLVRVFDCPRLGAAPIFADFMVEGRYDMLIPKPDGLVAMTVDGTLLWETDVEVRGIVFSKGHGEYGRMIYGFTGVRNKRSGIDIRGTTQKMIVSDAMIVLKGSTGEVVATRPVPEQDPTARFPDYSQTSGNMTGKDGCDIVLREWRDNMGGGGTNLWAYDSQLNPLWHYNIEGAYYGHHYAVQFFDVDGDGRDELLAGGILFDGAGKVIWRHDRADEMMRIVGAHHYDAVALGNFAGDDAVDPVAFLLGGSAGVYVVDGLTGKTRAVHRIGHAQGRLIGKVRDDIPGEQVLVATRWGNMGILTLFSGHGERLWSIQPDYIGQGAIPIQWGACCPKLIWTNTTGPVQAFYDGYGRRVKQLTELQRLWGSRTRGAVGVGVIKMGHDATDYITLTIDGKMHVFGPANRVQGHVPVFE